MWRDILNIDPSCEEDFFNFDSLPGKGKSFIACAGVSHLRSEYRVGKTGKGEYFNGQQNDRVHVHYLISTKSGGATLSLDSGQQAVSPNTIMLIPAGTPFLYELDGDHWDMCWLLLHDCPEYQFIRQLNAGVWQSENAALLYQVMAMIRDFDHSDGHYQPDIQLRLIEVLLYQIEQTLKKTPTQSVQQQRFQALMRSVTKQLQLPWSVKSLAAELHISEPQFYRLCKKETGKTPMKLLTHSRMEYACYLLRYTHYSLEQIADTVGYADSASFAHRFKQLYQVSPGRWRNSNDKNHQHDE
ncbi:AraC family transcriptional regulator [Aliiglaciecola sp. LCG003]|uniref:helix-turn-helix transcriptional regulator n=1 Tax=Aliiglaciecola sp. LCG003 TaxID=3053655 RepID=UPI002573F1CD|nr:AraC family transcriptional regulator [Aliiglaciecola sp. LCG003]WJG10676.1 AraC family transcriptional regulator [Aliiglaciecola sp. LCG003]